jgi:hypothetical protein
VRSKSKWASRQKEWNTAMITLWLCEVCESGIVLLSARLKCLESSENGLFQLVRLIMHAEKQIRCRLQYDISATDQGITAG